MNKDKIIKDLKKRNDSLKMQYEYRNIRCIHLEKENDRLQQENQQLKKQKDDVVEYIKKYLHEHIIDDLPDEESKFEMEDGIPIPNAKEILLRMLGETDD